MAIPEAQLETWSHRGATGPSRDTYERVGEALRSRNAPFATKDPEVFLQGSYNNDTNIARDSDVDVVARISSTFAHDAWTLPAEQYQAFERAHPGSAAYSYQNYKHDVAQWLTANFGDRVRVGRKAIYIPPGPNRRECDVVAAIEYRYYRRFVNTQDQQFDPGICFYLPDSTQIVNFPKQHAANCTAKHQATNSWFKPTVRIYKNMRNHMVERRLLSDGEAPSYFIEGLLYNVPNNAFGGTYGATVLAALSHCVQNNRAEFKCANGIQKLLGDSPVQWPAANCLNFLAAAVQLWGNWR